MSDNPDTADFGFQRVPRAAKRGMVRAVFDSVAPRYDLMNDLMSLGIHHFWKQVLVTEYRTGAAIGWHKDRSVFGTVVGISLVSACVFRLRRKSGASWERASLRLDQRSAYLLAGPVRTHWEHSIPAVGELRYSLTFRNLKDERCKR